MTLAEPCRSRGHAVTYLGRTGLPPSPERPQSHVNRSEVRHSRPSAPVASDSRGAAPPDRCQDFRQGSPGSPRSGEPSAKGRDRPDPDSGAGGTDGWSIRGVDVDARIAARRHGQDCAPCGDLSEYPVSE